MTSLNKTLQRRRFCNVVRSFHRNYMATSERRWTVTSQQRCNDVIVSTGESVAVGNSSYDFNLSITKQSSGHFTSLILCDLSLPRTIFKKEKHPKSDEGVWMPTILQAACFISPSFKKC